MNGLPSGCAAFPRGSFPEVFCRDLRQLPELYAGWELSKKDFKPEDFVSAMEAEAIRTLQRKQHSLKKDGKEALITKRFTSCTSIKELKNFVQEVLIARRLALSWNEQPEKERGEGTA